MCGRHPVRELCCTSASLMNLGETIMHPLLGKGGWGGPLTELATREYVKN